jgi:hypothetical protein
MLDRRYKENVGNEEIMLSKVVILLLNVDGMEFT